MPNDPKTPHRTIRLNDEDWTALGAAAGKSDRTAVIRDFVRWYLRRPGATLPKRPAQQEGRL